MPDIKDSAPVQKVEAAEKRFQPLLDFWAKVSNDWNFQLASMLSYSFLTSLFPLLLVIVAIAGLVIGAVSHDSLLAFENSVSKALPAGIGPQFINAVVKDLNKNAGPILIIGVLTALFGGSRLFIAIENCAGIIFRLRGRAPLQQNLTAVGMTLLYVILVPIIIGADALPGVLFGALGFSTHQGFSGFLVQLLGIVTGFIAAVILFGAIYIIVPNRPVHLKEVWKGVLAAGALLVLYELLFPLYTSTLLKPGNYGALAGFAIVILVFFYYLSFILLLGMEINSWASGQRQTAGDIQSIIHEVQAHNSTRGAAGPTAGTKTEDIEHHKGAQAMRDGQTAIKHERTDHHYDMQPPKYAEANKQDATSGKNSATSPDQQPTTSTRSNGDRPQSAMPARLPGTVTRPLPPKQSIAAEVIVLGATIAPALWWMLRHARR
jgi:membrane protein